MTGPGIGLVTGGNAFYFAVNFSDTPASFRPHAGCIPQPRGQKALQAAAGDAVRTHNVRLRPSRTVTSGHQCRADERLVRGAAGVLFHRRRPPTARELRDVTVTYRTGRQRVRARVLTGPSVGDRERVMLQIIAVCRGPLDIAWAIPSRQRQRQTAQPSGPMSEVATVSLRCITPE